MKNQCGDVFRYDISMTKRNVLFIVICHLSDKLFHKHVMFPFTVNVTLFLNP